MDSETETPASGPDFAAAPSEPLARLLWVMAWLRTPDAGCAWDLQQNFSTIAPYTIEEAYEVADAIEQGDMPALREELGDLLLQVVFHARMAEEAGDFDFSDVAGAIADKMIARHPHVFTGEKTNDIGALHRNWEAMKADERARKNGPAVTEQPGVLDGVAKALPALLRAHKLQKRAARVGFDWKDLAPVFDKINEELLELRSAVETGEPNASIEAEIGDVLFSAVNLSRHLGFDPEQALTAGNRKFEKRFRAMEKALRHQGLQPDQVDADRLEAEWTKAKRYD